MKPITFKEANTEFAKNQPKYGTLPAHKNDSQSGEVTTCWNLSFRERLKVLFTGKIWLCLLTFNQPLTPTYMTTNKKELL